MGNENTSTIVDFELYIYILRREAAAGRVNLEMLSRRLKKFLAEEIVEYCESPFFPRRDELSEAELEAMKALEAECRDFLENECALQEVEKSEGDPLVDLEDVAEELESETGDTLNTLNETKNEPSAE